MSIRAFPIDVQWNEDLPIFCSEDYLKSMSEEYGWIEGTKEGGAPVCILPYYMVKEPFLRMVRFSSDTVMLDYGLSLDIEKEFLNAVVNHFRAVGVDLIMPATFNSLFRTFPDGASVAPYGTFVVDLSFSEEALWKNVHPKHRNVIRNAEKRGTKIVIDKTYLSQAERLVHQSFERSTRGFINKLRLKLRTREGAILSQSSGLGAHVKVFTAIYADNVQGSAILPFSNYSAFYMHGGSIASPITGAMNLLQWEAIKHFRQCGVKYYNFVGARISPEQGSKQAGLAMFKQRFGGEFRRGYMWKYYFRPLKSFLYFLGSKIRSSGDIVDQEKHKSLDA